MGKPKKATKKKVSVKEVEAIVSELRIGEVIKRLRRANRWSRRELARAAGISPAAVYKIENDQMVPTVATIVKIARALRKNIQDILSIDAHEEFTVVKSGERLRFNTPEFPMTVERISGELAGRRLEAGIIVLKKGSPVAKKPMIHEGEEIHFILKGKVSYTIGGQTVELSRGDSIHFFARNPHTWKNVGEGEAEVLVVITPSPFV